MYCISIWLICTTHSNLTVYVLLIFTTHYLMTHMYMYCQFDSYVLPITCIHMLHVFISIWLICTTHYLHTRFTHIVLNLTHMYYPLPVYTFYCIVLNLTHMYYPLPAYTFDSHVLFIVIWLICTTHYLYTRVTCIVLNLTHMYYPLPVTHTCYMYCSQFDSYVLPIPVYNLTCICTLNLTHIYYPLPVFVTCIALNLTHMYYSYYLIHICTTSLFSIWLICTTHYLYTFTCIVLNLTHIYYHGNYLYTYVTCIVLNLTHMYYPLPVYTCYMYCSQFDSYVLPIPNIHILHVFILNLTHIYYSYVLL